MGRVSDLARDLARSLAPERWVREVLGWTPDGRQSELLAAEDQRVILNCTRQWGKSTTTAAAAVHRAVNRPRELILVVSKSARQAAELLRKMEEFAGQAGEKVKGDGDNALSLVFGNSSRVVGLPGKEATIRGFSGCGLLIVDEAAQVQDATYYAMRPTLATRTDARVWLLSTPWGKRGFYYREWTEGKAWRRVRVPAAECPRIAPEYLAEERRVLGEWWFKQEYECEFVDPGDAIFGHERVMQAITPEVEAL
jgi:hypothetical protein